MRRSGRIRLGLFSATLLLSLFGWKAWTLLSPVVRPEADSRTVVRIAHMHLSKDLKAAYSQAIENYERLNPSIKVEQILVPYRLYSVWIRSQLTGGTAPDLLVVGPAVTSDDLATYFEPLGAYVSQPNPYNSGTPLAEVVWRDTFLDGLRSDTNFHPFLLENFAVPLMSVTIRLYYNPELFRELSGLDEPPRDHEAFLEACREIQRRARARGLAIIPIAGSDELAERFFNTASLSLTQVLAENLSPQFSMSEEDAAHAFLRDKWNLRTPAIQAAFEAIRDVSQFMQQGFAETDRSQAMFYFAQRRAVMMASGSWELSNMRDMEPDMQLRIAPMPEPDPQSLRFRDLVRGPLADSSTWTDANFGIYRHTRVKSAALDFLHYLTSYSANAAFNETGFRLSSVVGVPPSSAMRPFKPREDGYPPGFDPLFRNFGGKYTIRLVKTQMHHLISPQGSVESFTRALEPRFAIELARDLSFSNKRGRQAARQLDAALTASWMLAEPGPDEEHHGTSRIAEVQWLRFYQMLLSDSTVE